MFYTRRSRALPAVGTAETLPAFLRLCAPRDAFHGAVGARDARQIQLPLAQIRPHLAPFKGRFADAVQVVNPAIMVVEQAHVFGMMLGVDIARVNGHLQRVIRVKIAAGLVVHQEKALIPDQYKVDHPHQRRQAGVDRKHKGVLDAPDLIIGPYVRAVHLVGVADMALFQPRAFINNCFVLCANPAGGIGAHILIGAGNEGVHALAFDEIIRDRIQFLIAHILQVIAVGAELQRRHLAEAEVRDALAPDRFGEKVGITAVGGEHGLDAVFGLLVWRGHCFIAVLPLV